MKNILLTGMTAQHTSKTLSAKTQSFSGLVGTALTEHGWNVDQQAPSIAWTKQDLDKYDAIVVGIAPLTSTSAHRTYGALSMLEVLKDDDRLTLLVDAPESYKIWTSLRAVDRAPESLVKSFYKNRHEYQEAVEPMAQARLVKVVRQLLNDSWPRTMYPAFPWSNDEHLVSQIPALSDSDIFSVCLDSFILRDTVKPTAARFGTSWWSATALHTDWTNEVRKQLHHTVVPVKRHPKSTDAQALATIAGAVGLLVSTYRGSCPWWTNRLAQGLAVDTPTVTDWRHSAGTGSDWATLPSTIESMDKLERYEMAVRQRVTYVEAIPTIAQATTQVQTALNMQRQTIGAL